MHAAVWSKGVQPGGKSNRILLAYEAKVNKSSDAKRQSGMQLVVLRCEQALAIAIVDGAGSPLDDGTDVRIPVGARWCPSTGTSSITRVCTCMGVL